MARYLTFDERAGTLPQQPCDGEHGQYGGDELGHVAGIGALPYRIDQGASPLLLLTSKI
jgi:hypothetical protein